MSTDPWPRIARDPPPPPDPREVRFAPKLALPPLDLPKRGQGDPVFTRRVEAERLCLWLACRRALCRSSRHCTGPHAACLFEQPEVLSPLLEEG
ncbi:MAG TPA: hypothetical protein VFB16_07995 [Bauldia sp.]|nr:hypothetical protein [Bauldia sp.]